MSEIDEELITRLAAANAQLADILVARADAEAAIGDAESVLAERQAALQLLLDQEGSLRGSIGELRRMIEALEVGHHHEA